MKLITEYNAPPAEEAFELATVEELRKIKSCIADAEVSARQSEFAHDALLCDAESVEKAIAAAEGGASVLMAQDEDGYYFAIEDEDQPDDDMCSGCGGVVVLRDDGTLECRCASMPVDLKAEMPEYWRISGRTGRRLRKMTPQFELLSSLTLRLAEMEGK